MRKILSRRPSPGAVIGMIALFIALAGTAYAATLPRNSVGARQLQRGAVTAPKLANSELRETSVEVPDAAKDGSWTSRTVKAQCRTGQVAIGAGTLWANPGNDDNLATMYTFYASSGGRRTAVFARGVNDTGETQSFRVQAVCLER